MTAYKSPVGKPFNELSFADMLSNQVVLSGQDVSFTVKEGTFLLTSLKVDGAGSITIVDGKGNTIVSGVTDFNQPGNPIRCDYGVTLTGDVLIAVGAAFFGVFAK